MMSALLHWAVADWPALAHDLGDMGLLKQSTDRAQLAADLQQQFTRLYADLPVRQDSSVANYSSSGSGKLADSTAAGLQTAAAAAGPGREKHHHHQQQQSALLSRAGAISFGDFAGVIAALAVKYRCELPPYYTLVIRCAAFLCLMPVSVQCQPAAAELCCWTCALPACMFPHSVAFEEDKTHMHLQSTMMDSFMMKHVTPICLHVAA
jgi:hypothetical protein